MSGINTLHTLLNQMGLQRVAKGPSHLYRYPIRWYEQVNSPEIATSYRPVVGALKTRLMDMGWQRVAVGRYECASVPNVTVAFTVAGIVLHRTGETANADDVIFDKAQRIAKSFGGWLMPKAITKLAPGSDDKAAGSLVVFQTRRPMPGAPTPLMGGVTFDTRMLPNLVLRVRQQLKGSLVTVEYLKSGKGVLNFVFNVPAPAGFSPAK